MRERRDAASRRRRRISTGEELLCAVAMVIVGALPCIGGFLLAPGAWAAIVGGLLFWPFAFFGGCLFLWARGI